MSKNLATRRQKNISRLVREQRVQLRDKLNSKKLSASSFKKGTFQMKKVPLAAWVFILIFTSYAFAELERKIITKTKKEKIIGYYKDGEEIAAETVSKNGVGKLTGIILDGIYKEYDKKGYLRYKWEYKGGKLDGMSVEYYDGRRKKYEWHYTDGKFNGPSRYYSGYGYLMRERLYKNGILNGISKEYFPTGEIKREISYVEGKKHGIAKDYYRRGGVKTEKDYKDDSLFKTRLYSENGKPVISR